MSSKGEFRFGEDRRDDQRVGGFKRSGRFCLQEYAKRDGVVIVDSLAWMAADRWLDLGRCR